MQGRDAVSVKIYFILPTVGTLIDVLTWTPIPKPQLFWISPPPAACAWPQSSAIHIDTAILTKARFVQGLWRDLKPRPELSEERRVAFYEAIDLIAFSAEGEADLCPAFATAA